MSGVQQSSSNSVTTDSRLTNIEKTMNEISKMPKNHQMNATYDPNNPKTKQHFFSVLHILQEIWPLSKFLLVTQQKKTKRGKSTYSTKKDKLTKTTRTGQNRQTPTDLNPIVAPTPKEDVATLLMFLTEIGVKVTVTPELFVL